MSAVIRAFGLVCVLLALCCLGCDQHDRAPKQEEIGEFQFSGKDILGKSAYSVPVYLNSGTEVWIGVDMDESPQWEPQGQVSEAESPIDPECRLVVSTVDSASSSETSSVTTGKLAVPGRKSPSPNQGRGFGDPVKFAFKKSYMEMRLKPSESGEYNVAFTHKLKPGQKPFGKYHLYIFQQKLAEE